MKKRNLILSAAITAAFFATSAQAIGTVSPTAAGVGMITYATEAIGATTAVTLPTIVYTMGVGRSATGQDMTIIYTLPAGSTFAATPAIPVYARVAAGPTSVPAITLKRGGSGTNEVVYSVSIDPTTTGTGISATDTFTLTGAQIKAGAANLNAVGATYAIKVKLLDQVEFACVDNNYIPSDCFLTSKVATLANAADFWNSYDGVRGVYTDYNRTVTSVYATVPLAGFLVTAGVTPSGDDSLDTARAIVRVLGNVTGSVMAADGTTPYAMVAGDEVTITISDPTGFLGLATDGLTYSSGSPVAFTVTGNNATLTLPGNDSLFNYNRAVNYLAGGTISMGTSRTLGITGRIVPVSGGPAHDFTGNASWWTWTSNGTILETSFFSNVDGYNNRFSFMNYGDSDVSYSAKCLVEAGKAAVLGTAGTGTLKAGTQTVLLSKDVCTVSGAALATGNTAQRGSVRFTINAPSAIVKGVYNSVSPNGSIDSIELVRPTSNAVQD